MMLIRSSLPSSNPVTLPDAVCIALGPESKTEKSRKFNDFSLFFIIFWTENRGFASNFDRNLWTPILLYYRETKKIVWDWHVHRKIIITTRSLKAWKTIATQTIVIHTIADKQLPPKTIATTHKWAQMKLRWPRMTPMTQNVPKWAWISSSEPGWVWISLNVCGDNCVGDNCLGGNCFGWQLFVCNGHIQKNETFTPS